MKYIKLFNQHSDYNTFKASDEFIQPNVSRCLDDSDLHYIPRLEVKLQITYEVSDSNPTQLYYYDSVNTGNSKFFKIELNSNELSINSIDQNEGKYQLATGSHAITYTLKTNEIDYKAFFNCENIKSIIIPAEIKKIALKAFSGCSKLSNITVNSNNPIYDSRDNCNAIIHTKTDKLIIGCKDTVVPDSIKIIGPYSFESCSGLTTISIPSSLEITSSFAYYNCNNITKVIINNQELLSKTHTSSSNIVTMFGSNVNEYVIGDNIFYIGDYAFSGATASKITIGSNVNTIGSNVFYHSQFNNIVVDSNNLIYDSRNNCNAIIETNTNTLIIGCSTTTIPNTVTTIGKQAFAYTNGSTNIVIPSSVTSIKENAFGDCEGLVSITMDSAVPATLTSTSLNGDFVIKVPCSSYFTYRNSWTNYSSRISLISDECLQTRWTDLGQVCINEEYHMRQKKQISSDGETWYDTTETRDLPEVLGECHELVTIDLNSEWQNSTSYGNLESANYRFYESNSNKGVNNGKSSMIITIQGYSTFTFKVRNYSESNFDYVVVNNLDDLTSPSWQPSQGNGTASSGKVYYTNKGNSSSTTWYDVTFSNIDVSEEHSIMITYGKDSSSHTADDRGYVAISNTYTFNN